MRYVILMLVITVPAIALAKPIRPRDTPKPAGILVLDNCDAEYQGKDAYRDNLTLVDAAGKQTFRVSGFNNCESTGCSRMIAADPARQCVWVIENVADRIRRFDLSGKETLAINGVHGSAIAVDPETGNLSALISEGRVDIGKTLVFDNKGKVITAHDTFGWDIVYDKKAKAFWIAAKNLTKVSAATGEVVLGANHDLVRVEYRHRSADWCRMGRGSAT